MGFIATDGVVPCLPVTALDVIDRKMPGLAKRWCGVPSNANHSATDLFEDARSAAQTAGNFTRLRRRRVGDNKEAVVPLAAVTAINTAPPPPKPLSAVQPRASTRTWLGRFFLGWVLLLLL